MATKTITDIPIQNVGVLVAHDGGTIDPDDVVALAALIKRKIRVHIMACGAGNNKKVLEFLKNNAYITIAPEKTKIRMETFLLIGPSANVLLPWLDFSRCKHFVFMGNTTSMDTVGMKYRCEFPCTSPSLNEKNNSAVFQAIAEEQQRRLIPSDAIFDKNSHVVISKPTLYVDVITTQECYENKNMFGAKMLGPKGEISFLTKKQKNIVWASMLKNFAGRMHPLLPYNQFAEGLINGTPPKGANYLSVKRVHDCVRPSLLKVKGGSLIPKACEKYITELKRALEKKDKTLLNEKSLYFKLLITTQRVADILGAEPVDEMGRLFTSTTAGCKPNDIAGAYPIAFEAFKKVPFVVPAYDLAAQRYII